MKFLKLPEPKCITTADGSTATDRRCCLLGVKRSSGQIVRLSYGIKCLNSDFSGNKKGGMNLTESFANGQVVPQSVWGDRSELDSDGFW